MSNSGLFQLKANIQTDTLRLLPDGPLNLKMSLRFDSGGVLDFEDAVDQVIGGLESHMGKLKSVTQADRDSIKAQLAPCIIEQAIHSISDVLEDFEDDGEPYWDDELRLHIPLRMKGSGYQIDLTVYTTGKGAELNFIRDQIESAYQLVITELRDFLQNVGNALTNEQKKGIDKRVLPFLDEKGRKAAERLLSAVQFELITDGDSWLRGGGSITVRLTIKVDQFEYTGPPKQIYVHSTNNAFFDLKKIARQLGDILTDYLAGNIALNQFAGDIKTKMIKEWEKRANGWLIEDIRKDLAIFDYMQFKVENGTRLVLQNAFARQPIKVDIKYKDGICSFYDMECDITKKTGKLLKIEDKIFTPAQRSAMEKAMAPALVKAVRNKAFCYPYSQDTKNQLLAMEQYIKNAAKNVKVTPLALAGAVADALDDNLEIRVQEHYKLRRRFLIEFIRRNSENIAGTVSFLFTLLGNTYVGLPASASGLVWDSMLPKAKEDITVFTSEIFDEAVMLLIEEAHKSTAAGRDVRNDNLIKLEVLKNIDPDMISMESRKKFQKDVDETLEKLIDLDQLFFTMLTVGSDYSGKIISIAKAIERVLKDCNKDPKERQYVTKWERFYHFFT